MQRYEYRVVPAPLRAERVKGLRTTAERFAHALAALMNSLGREGWEYVRADALPCEERTGLVSRATSTQHVLVFRRPLPEAAAAAAPAPAAAPAALRAGGETAPLPPLPPAEPAPGATAAPGALPPLREVPRLRTPAEGGAGGDRGILPKLGAAPGRGLFRAPLRISATPPRGDSTPD